VGLAFKPYEPPEDHAEEKFKYYFLERNHIGYPTDYFIVTL
jgi:hypothetical protein